MIYSCHREGQAALRRQSRHTATIGKVARAGMGPVANRKPGSTQRRFNPSTFRQTERLPARTGPRLENGQATSLCRCESCTLLHQSLPGAGAMAPAAPTGCGRMGRRGPPHPAFCRLSSTRQSAAVRRRRFQGQILGVTPTPGCSAEVAHLSDTEAAVVQLHPARPVPVSCPHNLGVHSPSKAPRASPPAPPQPGGLARGRPTIWRTLTAVAYTPS